MQVEHSRIQSLQFGDGQAEYRHEAASAIRSVEGLTVACLLQDLAAAKTLAAISLEAEEAALLSTVTGKE